MANDDRKPQQDPDLAGYDNHLGVHWGEWGDWVHHLDAEHMDRFRAELERLLPDKPKVADLLCREPSVRRPWAKDLSPEMRAWIESIPDDEDAEAEETEVVFLLKGRVDPE